MRDAEIARVILPVVRGHYLSQADTEKALVELNVPRAANIARIASELAKRSLDSASRRKIANAFSVEIGDDNIILRSLQPFQGLVGRAREVNLNIGVRKHTPLAYVLIGIIIIYPQDGCTIRIAFEAGKAGRERLATFLADRFEYCRRWI